ncbi:toprim domain-containing protein [Parabacteroides sp. BX2]|uniref:Toprim domain-containing protein n=1 Tax=Parabacteroides segnis TaxID=2763058 RepID=A0ABR7DWD9_9BACT|nr:toprim domain-containing protein [Parabacteroides segnis]MBC5641801.1 toprim domain-containing protein [Parabacteroides segnis]HCY68926.1 DNA primase [Bacteroides cellulosilyticus]
MNIAQIKQIDLVDYMKAIGFSPTKETAKSAWYHAPYREDRTPSFKVNKDKNVWYDFGTAQSGDIIDLAELLYHSKDVSRLLKLIEGAAPALAPLIRTPISQSGERLTERFRNVKVVDLNHEALKSYLQSRGIDLDIGECECKEIHYTCNKKGYFAVAFPNIAGGYEIRNPYFKGCIAPKDISIIRKPDRLGGRCCCLFEGFMDYLSYLALVKLGKITEDNESVDYIVLNSVSNIGRAIESMKKYKVIHCYLDNDDAGRRAVNFLHELLGDKVQDMFAPYPLYKDLNDFLRNKKKIS